MAEQDTTLELSFDLHPLAPRPDLKRFGRRWDTHIVVDGKDHVFEEDEIHRVKVSPGPHQIELYFTGAGLQRLGGMLGLRHGRCAVKIEARTGFTVRLQFRGGLLWSVRGGELVRL